MKTKYLVNNVEVDVEILVKTQDEVTFKLGKTIYNYKKRAALGDSTVLESNSKMLRGSSIKDSLNGIYFVESCGLTTQVEQSQGRKKSSSSSANSLKSPMPGKVFKVLVSEGDKVEVGQPILIVEAMKMEHSVKANKNGILKRVLFKEGQQVKGGALLAEIE